MNSTAHIMSLCSVNVKHDVYVKVSYMLELGTREICITLEQCSVLLWQHIEYSQVTCHIIIAMHNTLCNLHIHIFANSCTAVDCVKYLPLVLVPCESLPQTS